MHCIRKKKKREKKRRKSKRVSNIVIGARDAIIQNSLADRDRNIGLNNLRLSRIKQREGKEGGFDGVVFHTNVCETACI